MQLISAWSALVLDSQGCAIGIWIPKPWSIFKFKLPSVPLYSTGPLAKVPWHFYSLEERSAEHVNLMTKNWLSKESPNMPMHTVINRQYFWNWCIRSPKWIIKHNRFRSRGPSKTQWTHASRFCISTIRLATTAPSTSLVGRYSATLNVWWHETIPLIRVSQRVSHVKSKTCDITAKYSPQILAVHIYTAKKLALQANIFKFFNVEHFFLLLITFCTDFLIP